MSAPENPPAFPREDYQADDAPGQRGMSLRDYFAAQALIAIVGNAEDEAISDVCQGIRGGRPMAYGAYVLADAMLKARKS